MTGLQGERVKAGDAALRGSLRGVKKITYNLSYFETIEAHSALHSIKINR